MSDFCTNVQFSGFSNLSNDEKTVLREFFKKESRFGMVEFEQGKISAYPPLSMKELVFLRSFLEQQLPGYNVPWSGDGTDFVYELKKK